MKSILPLLLTLSSLSCLWSAPTAPSPQDIFLRLDKNKDGKITKDELPTERQGQFPRVDKNGDGQISLEEHHQFLGKPLQNKQETIIPALPEGVTAKRDLNYAGGKNPRQALDLYLPAKSLESKAKLPVIVFIHGGGWKGGDKLAGAKHLLPYVQSGQYAGASIGYRLSDEAQWPAQLYDCKAAIRWLRANAKEHRLDPEHIAVWGTSAGGHLASILGTGGDVPKLEGNVGPHLAHKSHVQCVVNYFGPQNFITMAQQKSSTAKKENSQPSPEDLLLGGKMEERLGLARQASPVTYVSPSDPPVLIAHGTADPLVPFTQAEEFHTKLQSLKVPSVLITMKDAGHGFNSELLTKRVNSFFAKHLLGTEAELKDEVIPLKP